MSTLTIASFTIQNFHRAGSSARLKIWFAQDFVTKENQLVLGGAVRSGSIYLDQACTLDPDTHVLTVPAFTLPTTDDSSLRDVRATGVLFDASGAFVRNLFTGWVIFSSLAPASTFASLNALNAPPRPSVPAASGITREQCLTLIAEGLQAGPIGGTLSTGTVPRASGPKTLVDGQIVDLGEDVSIQTFNSVQGGDYQFLQHGTYFRVNDFEGIANLLAGSDNQAQYAGIVGRCASGNAEVFLQSTGYDNLYGNKNVTRIGDSNSDNNGTLIEINDTTQRIRFTNLPTSDPHVAGVLWVDGSTLKISGG